jgi:excisionase family DNA binding protein
MEDTFFTVEEAASVLGCKKRTVYRLLDDGWLNKPPGGTKNDGLGRVSKKSLFQFMVIDRLSRLPAKTLRDMRNGRKHFGRIWCTIANANRFSLVEGRHDPAEARPAAVQENPERKRCLHHDFAEQRQFSFGWRARQLAPGDPAMQDDLVQEMSLAALEHNKPADFEFLFELAGNRAIDYLRYETARGMLPLSEAREASDQCAEQMSSLNAFIGGLLQRGVPREWIEEALGGRLEAA